MPAELFHVMTLTPRQQATIRLCLYNLYCSYIKKTMDDLMDHVGAHDIERAIEVKYSMMIRNFSSYNDFTEVFCARSGASRAENKLVTISQEGMKNIMLALQGYDSKNCFLSPSDVSYVQAEVDKISKLVNESAHYAFTADEIRRGGR